MAFDSLLGSSKRCYKFWSFLNIFMINILLIDCIIVHSQNFRKKGTSESLKGKVISNSSVTLSSFLCVARNLGKKPISS